LQSKSAIKSAAGQNPALAVKTVRVESNENLREATRDSDIEIVQLRAGKQQGSLVHIGIRDVSLSLCHFSIEFRGRGVISPDKFTIGTMLASARGGLFWGEEVSSGDVVTFPPGIEADAIYGSGSSYAAILIEPAELVSLFKSEGRLADPAVWIKRGVQRYDPLLTDEVRRRLTEIGSSLQRHGATASNQTLDFFRRSIVEAFAPGLVCATPRDRIPARVTGARLVREVEGYVDAAGDRAVHISELCNALKVSRRTLHRAFVDTMNMGPVGYLRCRRLSAIQTILKRTDPTTVGIAEIAFEYGFTEPSRFAAYYRSFFGETPSDTRRSVSQ
jgi:AraC family ethanolamine operon transcriptional activator